MFMPKNNRSPRYRTPMLIVSPSMAPSYFSTRRLPIGSRLRYASCGYVRSPRFINSPFAFLGFNMEQTSLFWDLIWSKQISTYFFKIRRRQKIGRKRRECLSATSISVRHPVAVVVQVTHPGQTACQSNASDRVRPRAFLWMCLLS